MTELISRKAARDACHAVADEAKRYGIPQMALGAHTCRDAILALPTAASMEALEAEVARLAADRDAWRGLTMYAAGGFTRRTAREDAAEAKLVQATDGGYVSAADYVALRKQLDNVTAELMKLKTTQRRP